MDLVSGVNDLDVGGDDRVWTRDSAVEEDKRLIKDVCHQYHIQAFTKDFCILTSHRTPYRRIKIKLTFLDTYPQSVVDVVVESDTLPTKLLGKLKGMCEAKISSKDGLGLLGKPQVAAVYSFLDEMIHDNRLLYATPEIRQIRALSKEPPEFTVIVKELEGLVKIRATCGKYSLKATLTVPDEYPAEQVDIDFTSCTFPEPIWMTYLLQAREISRKLAAGMKAERAIRTSTGAGLGLAPPGAAGGGPEIKLTTAYVRDLKHDVAFLKKATDLRAVDSGYNKMLHQYDYSTRIRRAARRELKKLSVQEAEKERKVEEARVEEAEKEQLKAWKRLVGQSEDGPQRSIKHLVEFLTLQFIFRLPTLKCRASGDALFPEDPAELKTLVEKRKKARPVRVPTCGCWFKYSALKKFLTEPPFGKACPGPSCEGIVVQHPDWTNDLKQLEKSWAMKQAREREIAEVTDFFGLDKEFQH
mmetsp:Transcript_8381/g.18343  ORF Transcript_8381/g.18343 Transcript_8381/m.18343 type:complete len:471 (+) Transcript_8381:184-1596(+)